MFAWGKTPLLSPGKSPFGWNPRSNAALPEADRSIWNPATAADRDDDCCGVWATWASRLWFSSSTASKLCVFGVLAIFYLFFAYHQYVSNLYWRWNFRHKNIIYCGDMRGVMRTRRENSGNDGVKQEVALESRTRHTQRRGTQHCVVNHGYTLSDRFELF